MDELGKSIPAAEGMTAAEEGTRPKQNNEYCLNCGTKLLDAYCHHCGQKDLPKRQSLKELIENFIGSFFSFESKFFRTVKFLLFRPGFLPEEYTAGKREAYYHPARAYVFISFIFFLLLFSLPDESDMEPVLTEEDKTELKIAGEETEQRGQAVLDSLNIRPDSTVPEPDTLIIIGGEKKIQSKKNGLGFSLTNSPYKTVSQYDSAQSVLPEAKRDGWFLRTLTRKNIELNQRYQGEDGGSRFGRDFGQAFLNNFSKVLFFLLPVFALLLKLVYVRRDFFYSEHLVFSIYYYNFFYLASSVYLLVDLLPWIGGLLNTIILLWIIAYLPLSMKRMYRQSWSKTILKFGFLSFSFSLCLLLGILVNLIFILLNL